MALSKLRELYNYEHKFTPIAMECFDIVKDTGFLGDHLRERSDRYPDGQVDPHAVGDPDIYHLVGSSASGTTMCRAFNNRGQNSGPITFEADILQELFEFDEKALGVSVVESQHTKGFYHVKLNEHTKESVRGRHFNTKQAIQLLDAAMKMDAAVFVETIKQVFPWNLEDVEFLRDTTSQYTNVESAKQMFEQWSGNIPPDFLKWAVAQSCCYAQRKPAKITTLYGDVVPESMKDILKFVDWKFEVTLNGPAVTTEVTVTLFGAITLGTLSLDMVTCAKLNFWPSAAVPFLTRKREWPSKKIIDKCQELPVQLVPKHPKQQESDNSEWYLSFAFQEKVLGDAMSDAMRFTFYVFKVLFYTHFKVEIQVGGMKESLSSYCAKTTMFWACEGIPADAWTEDNIEANLKTLVDKLYHYLEGSELPHYFVSGINLIENTPSEVINASLRAVRECGVLSDPIGSLPGEDQIQDVLNKYSTVAGPVHQNIDKIRDVLRKHPWGFMP